jgi:branched-chain amino acid transport system ATP-binding protein
LQLDEVSVHYGQLRAVKGITFSLREGEVWVLLGANGAGKSSLLRALVGLEPLASGEILFRGRSMKGVASHRRAATGIGYLPEGRGVFPSLTVEENIASGVLAAGREGEALEEAYSLFPALKERSQQLAGSLSGGEQQMVSLSRALAGRPRLLLLDELSLGLAPNLVSQLFAKVAELRTSGMTILLVEQFAHAALRIADRAGVMVRGELTRVGPAAEFARLSPDELAREYFGSTTPSPGGDDPAHERADEPGTARDGVVP